MNNPYNCSIPGNLFCGYDRMRQRIRSGFSNGSSFALIGGRRCGKTSLLKQLEKDLAAQGLPGMAPVSCFIDMQGEDFISPELLFEKIYNLVIQGTDAPKWERPKENRPYSGFLEHLKGAAGAMNKRYGPRWLAILFIDELDSALDKLADDQFFQNLRNLLMVSSFSSYFRLIASGVRDMARLISSGSSPLNNLTCHYLKTLSKSEARGLIKAGLQDRLDEDAAGHVLTLTGGHPYLMQGLLEKLWDAKQNGADITVREIKGLAREFLAEHKAMYKWVELFDEGEHAVYRFLANAPDGKATVGQIRGSIDRNLAGKVDDALCVLSYHGVIDDTDCDEPSVCGSMFRDWYRNRFPFEPTHKCSEPEPLPSNPVKGPSPVINVQVNPIINVTSHATVSYPAAQELLKEMRSIIDGLPIAGLTKKQAGLELEKVSVEVEKAAQGNQLNSSSVESSFKEAAKILKSAGTATEALHSFIDKAKAFGPYIGMAANVLMNLFQ